MNFQYNEKSTVLQQATRSDVSRLAGLHYTGDGTMTTKERLDRRDRQIAGITKLLQTGMRMLVKTQEEVRGLAGEVRGLTVEVKGLAVEVKGLAAVQERTEASLQAFIDSMKRSGNGHSKKPAGLS
jgi:hypothetical protein